MEKIKYLILITVLLNGIFAATAFSKSIPSPKKNYQAIVVGKAVKKSVIKSKNTYLTEYKIKTKKWLYKKETVKPSRYLTIKTLGAELPEQGIVIKASTSPEFIPLKKEAIFFLERNKAKQKDIFTLSRDGVIYKKAEDI